ncbi:MULTISPECIES: Hsp70 family protein [unclassified Prochlorococcus]|uniref:Hsp70 family protein n=1 Tax=unclassified Prochlorococcus TaxID=2627481 RepID=UPI00053397CA|nr:MULTISPECIES: Hsp70 family protein [unclassified Prochlorococcus]KGG14809.1 Molecular chaperone DnaK [Prochlorococcus sp. MIT 0602]KGG15758.1 Molecular chaperone DnaK [Prochlorococcus sp. MIT 0603]
MDSNENKLSGTLAIDLGSTTTVVAFQAENEDSIKLLNLPLISRCPGEVPSLIWQSSDQKSYFLFGQEVQKLGLTEKRDQNLINDFKRWIGAPKEDIPKHFNLSPKKAGELFLKEIWKRIPSNLQIKKLVLSAPVETYKEYRKWLNSVCDDLAVPEIALVDEPTAAAIGAGLPGGSTLLVIDLGGSTIDMSMVLIEGGEGQPEPIAQLIRFGGNDLEATSKQVFRGAKVLGKAGLRLGGRDFDKWILHYLFPKIKPSESLLDTAEKLKCRLSNQDISETKKLSEEIFINDQEGTKKFTLMRLEFEELLQEKGFFKSMSKLLEQTLAQGRSNGFEMADLTGVVIVGGGSQIPVIKRWLLNKVGKQNLLLPPPVEAVAIGAIKLTPGVTIRDVLNRGISLRFWDQKTNSHMWHPLFLPGQPWPTIKPLEIILSASTLNQLEIELRIADNQSNQLQKILYLNGIPTIQEEESTDNPNILPWLNDPIIINLDPPGKPGEDCIKLRFSIDKLCQLCVQGIDLRNEKTILEKVIGSIR